MWILILFLIFAALYLSGLLPVSFKSAASFVGNLGFGTDHCSASFTRCRGSIHRVMRFRESRSYSFSLTGHIQSGSVTVLLLDIRRNPVLTLDAAHPSGILNVQAFRLYFLVIRFQDASGDYHLTWA